MKPKDIVVGQKYKKHDMSGTWLGIGKRVMWEGAYTNKDSSFKNKQLVYIEQDDYFGMIVQDPKDCRPGFWDTFYEVKEKARKKNLKRKNLKRF